MRSYAFPVSIRKLFAILVALAVLFAPSVTYASTPLAVAHDHAMPMMEMGHCQMPPSKSADHSKADKNCCMAMCTALAVAPSAPAESTGPKHAQSYFAVPESWHGYLGEIATPPPRTA
jgi:hypothetical protein